MTTRNGGGGDEVFRALYGRYYGRMRRYFRRVFRVSDVDAEDLTQDTFVRFYASIREYRGEAEWALLETIARNVGYNRVRSLNTIKRGAVKPESLGDPDQSHLEPAVEQADAVDRLIKAENAALLHKEIEALSPGQRQCTTLWLSGYTYTEIAKALRISLDAVRSRLRDARRLLIERLGADGELPEDES